jgi:hypothetical protein
VVIVSLVGACPAGAGFTGIAISQTNRMKIFVLVASSADEIDDRL